MALGVAELASWHCGWGMGEYEEKKEKEENDDCPLHEHENEDGRENRQVLVKFERQVPGEELHVKHHYLSFTWSQVTPVVQEKEEDAQGCGLEHFSRDSPHPLSSLLILCPISIRKRKAAKDMDQSLSLSWQCHRPLSQG